MLNVCASSAVTATFPVSRRSSHLKIVRSGTGRGVVAAPRPPRSAQIDAGIAALQHVMPSAVFARAASCYRVPDLNLAGA